MTWALVAAANNSSASPGESSPWTLAFGGTGVVNTGDLLLVGMTHWTSTTVTVTDVTDTLGNDWHFSAPAVDYPSANNTCRMYIFWAKANGTGANTVTVSWSTSPLGGGEIWVAEFSGAGATAAQDGAGQGADGTSTSGTITTPTVTTAASTNDLLINYNECANTPTVNSPWTQLMNVSGDPVAYRLNVSASTYAPNVTMATGTWSGVTAAFRDAAGVSDLSVWAIN